MKIPFYIVDVFAEQRFSGNQLAVMISSNALTPDQMQDIAREMHFSETSFIGHGDALTNHYPVRIFTPEREVPFAGHPVLGTAFVIREEIMKRPGKEIILDLRVGEVPVSYALELGRPPMYWMVQPEPVFGRKHDAAQVARVLTLPVSEIDTRYPVREVSTGLPFLIVPVKSLDAIRSAKINIDEYEDLISGTEVKAVHIFCPESYDPDHHLNTRMFAPYYGVVEDPATGSANGCLAAYLYKHQYFDKIPEVILVEQGYEIHRPSLISCRVTEESGRITVEVGGSVILVAKGEMVVS